MTDGRGYMPGNLEPPFFPLFGAPRNVVAWIRVSFGAFFVEGWADEAVLLEIRAEGRVERVTWFARTIRIQRTMPKGAR